MKSVLHMLQIHVVYFLYQTDSCYLNTLLFYFITIFIQSAGGSSQVKHLEHFYVNVTLCKVPTSPTLPHLFKV